VEKELTAIRRLDDQARQIERNCSGLSVGALIAEERRLSRFYGGRSIFASFH